MGAIFFIPGLWKLMVTKVQLHKLVLEPFNSDISYMVQLSGLFERASSLLTIRKLIITMIVTFI